MTIHVDNQFYKHGPGVSVFVWCVWLFVENRAKFSIALFNSYLLCLFKQNVLVSTEFLYIPVFFFPAWEYHTVEVEEMMLMKFSQFMPYSKEKISSKNSAKTAAWKLIPGR